MARAARLPRTNCESCGIPLGRDWFARHSRAGHQRLCRPCLDDTLAQADAQDRLRLEVIEFMWKLKPGETDGDDDVERVTTP